ncbi:MAG: hypothetical protein HZB29_07675 [Nitrospinae bacterium]|nr:hypothetical protein [Nitrospinota bacterium]
MEIKELFGALIRRKNTFLAILFLTFFTIVGASLIIITSYKTTSKVFLWRSPAYFSILNTMGVPGSATSNSLDDTARADYLALSTLRPVADQVIKKLELKRNRIRAGIVKTIPFAARILGAIGVDWANAKKDMTAEDLIDSSLSSYIFPRPNITVEQHEDSNVFELKAYSEDRIEATNIANLMAEAFIDMEKERLKSDFLAAQKTLEANLGSANQLYASALKDMTDFKEKEGVISVDSQTSAAVQAIADLKKNLDDTKGMLARTKASLVNLEKQFTKIINENKSAEDFLAGDTLTTLKQSLVGLYSTLAEIKTKYTDQHPVYIETDEKIQDLRARIEAEMERSLSGALISVDPSYREITQKIVTAYSDAAGYESQISAYSRLLKKREDEMAILPFKQQRFTQLTSAVTTAQSALESVQKAIYLLAVAKKASLSNIYVVEPAIVPEEDDSRHRSPNMTINTIIAIFLSTILAVWGALFVEYFDDSVRTGRDFAGIEGVEFLGSVKKLGAKADKTIASSGIDPDFQESLRLIRSQIAFKADGGDIWSLAVSSASRKEGKSLIAANIAMALAMEGKNVALVDGNFRGEAFGSFLNVPRGTGLLDCLQGGVTADKVLVSTETKGLMAIPSGGQQKGKGALLATGKVREILNGLAGQFDAVILDGPSLDASADAVFLGREADAVALVVESGANSNIKIRDAIGSFRKSGARIAGAVINKTPDTSVKAQLAGLAALLRDKISGWKKDGAPA